MKWKNSSSICEIKVPSLKSDSGLRYCNSVLSASWIHFICISTPSKNKIKSRDMQNLHNDIMTKVHVQFAKLS